GERSGSFSILHRASSLCFQNHQPSPTSDPSADRRIVAGGVMRSLPRRRAKVSRAMRKSQPDALVHGSKSALGQLDRPPHVRGIKIAVLVVVALSAFVFFHT